MSLSQTEKEKMKTMPNVDRTSHSTVVQAQAVAREFLTDALPAVQRVDVVKVAPVLSGDAAWEAEAEVWQPNPTLKSLGIETGRPVLDHNHYLVRLDALFNVLEYELRESV
jgi:hypothetical protein